MKTNISLALNAILIVAVAVLFYLQLSAKHPNTAVVASKNSDDSTNVEPSESSSDFQQTASALSPAGRIVFVNTDTLLEKYDYFKKNKKRLETRSQQLEQELANRARALEEELGAAQQKVQAGLIPPAQAKALEQGLMAKQQALYEYRESRGRLLAEEERKFNLELNNRIRNFLKKQSSTNHYTYVMGYTTGGSILFANDSLDITKPVILGLNKSSKAK